MGFRVVDADNFFFAYTANSAATANAAILKVGYYSNGQRTDLSASAPLPDNWGTLIVVTTNLGEVKAYADNTLLYSANNPLMATATGAGLYNNSAGLGLTNRWDNFAVLNAP